MYDHAEQVGFGKANPVNLDESVLNKETFTVVTVSNIIFSSVSFIIFSSYSLCSTIPGDRRLSLAF